MKSDMSYLHCWRCDMFLATGMVAPITASFPPPATSFPPIAASFIPLTGSMIPVTAKAIPVGWAGLAPGGDATAKQRKQHQRALQHAADAAIDVERQRQGQAANRETRKGDHDG